VKRFPKPPDRLVALAGYNLGTKRTLAGLMDVTAISLRCAAAIERPATIERTENSRTRRCDHELLAAEVAL
jgi:hypothetical protein